MARHKGSAIMAAFTIAVLGLTLSPGYGQAIEVDERATVFSPVTTADLDVSSQGPTSPTGTGRPPRVGPNVRANAAQVAPPAGRFGRSETSIAATDDGQFLVAGWNDAEGFLRPPFASPGIPGTPGLSGYAFSTDGGVTWTDGGAPPLLGTSIVTRGDPWLDRGGFDNATFYYANLAVHLSTNVSLGISVHRGHFIGGTLVWQGVQAFNAPNPDDFYDKEALAMAKDGSGRGVISLTNFIELCGEPAFGFGQIEVWRTTDGGTTWVGPAIAGPDITFITDPADPGCGLTGVLQQSSAPAIGPDGEVYAVWQRGPTFTTTVSTNAEIAFARSLDGGATFETPVGVSPINTMRLNAPVGYNRDRINDHPRITVATTGPHRGRIYVVYYSAIAPTPSAAITPCPAPVTGLCRGQTLTSSQVFLRYSDDKGATWSQPIPLAPTPPAAGVKRFWPVVNVEPGGNISVLYYESREEAVSSGAVCQVTVATVRVGGVPTALRRRGTAHSLVDTFWVQSTNGGSSFTTPMTVSTATSDWCTTATNIRPNFGDYIDARAGGNRLLSLWADGRNGVPDSFFAHILGGQSGP